MADEVNGIPIDDDVPLPPARIKSSRYVDVLKQMEIGQSFLVYGNGEISRVRNNIKWGGKRDGKEFVTRKEPGNEPFYRVWRTK